MSSSKPTLTSLSSSVHKRVALAMSKGRPGSLSVPAFRFKPNTEEVTTEETVGEDLPSEESGLSAPLSPPSSPSTASKMSGSAAKKSTRTQSLDGDSPEGADSSNWSFLNGIKDKITRTVEENLNRIDSIIGSTGKAKAADPLAVVGAIEAAEDCTGNGSSEELASEVLQDLELYEATGRVERSYFEDPEISYSTEMIELRQRKIPEKGHSAPSSPMRFSDLSRMSPSCSVDENEQPAKEDSEAVDPSIGVHAANPETGPSKSSRWTIPKRLQLSRWNVFIIASLLLYSIFSFSPFMDGFAAGLALAVLLVYSWHRLTRPIRHPLAAPSAPHQTMQDMFHGEAALSIQKVWMNELLATASYSPESFHINQTQSVLVRLDGLMLRVSYTKGRIPKRAMWNEPAYEPTMVYQRIYDLEGAKLKLIPEGLARKRYWSRRYPIQLELVNGPCSRESGVPPHLAKEDPKTVLLFARTGRAKEEWFRLLQAACELQARDSEAGQERTRADLAYNVFMNRLIPSPSREAVSMAVMATDTPSDPPSPFVEIPSDFSTPSSAEGLAWVNAMLGRCFWDFVRDPEWAAMVRNKIQRKLAMIQVPSFIEELRLSEIELGTQLPQFGRVSAPALDPRGLWIDMQVAYYGAFRMTLETKLNLMKMKKMATAQQQVAEEAGSSALSGVTCWQRQQRLSSVYDDAAEETGESSSDDEAASEPGEGAAEEGTGSPRGGGETTGRKILRIVDSIAQSRYFQQATEYKYVKKAMEGVTTPLILTVELVSLNGTLAINIPPPPSDRLWYGFRGSPSLSLVVKPKVGERELQFSHIIEWIQNKLILEFQRILILPNMDDVIIPISSTGLLLLNQASVSPTFWPGKD